MPSIVSADKMQVGHKGRGKHWTKDQVAGRQAAADSMKRKRPVKLVPPTWVTDDLTVFAIWTKIVKDATELELLDNLDANTLATFCKLEAAKAEAVNGKDIELFDRLAKTALSYARSLGLTPEARARLAKKKADGEPKPNGHLFD